MRAKALLAGDIRFQYQYGFYLLYLIFSVLYISLIFLLPTAWRAKAVILMIFSDPAAMGLYFMGAILLFEKSERVLDSIAISPVKPGEYVLAKLLSIALISTGVGLLLGVTGGVLSDLATFLGGVFFGSCLFSAVGLMLAVKIATLNQFIIATIPAELLINLPAIAYLFGWKPRWLIWHPGVCIIELCQNGPDVLATGVILIGWTAVAVRFACLLMTENFKSLGGVKL
jgi:fluoroquinolone transport system permease protein